MFKDPEWGAKAHELWLGMAAATPNVEFLKLMMGMGVPVTSERALLTALTHKHNEHALLLIEALPKPFNEEYLLSGCILDGNIEMVRKLIPHCDIKAKDSEALKWAVVQNNHEIFDLLYPLSDPQACKELLKRTGHGRKMGMLTQRMKQEAHREILAKAVRVP